MPTQTTELTLNRTFYTEGAYIPDPPNSLYYTVGLSEPVTVEPYEGLYTLGALTESQQYAQLYEIPSSGRSVYTTDIITYSAVEDATTLNPGNVNGGTAQITVESRLFEDTAEFFTSDLRMVDSLSGDIRGIVRGLTLDDVTTSVTADSLTALFNVACTLPMANTNLRTAINTYFNALEVSMPVVYEDGLGQLAVRLPSQEGNAWDLFKQIAAAYHFEIAFLGGTMVIRKPRKETIDIPRATSLSRNINAQDVSRKVRIHYYDNVHKSNYEVYPVPDQPADIRIAGQEYSPSEPTIYTVDAGEVVRFTIDLRASLSKVNQPVYTEFVKNESYTGTQGVYSVIGNDDLPITKGQWDAFGGDLSVRLLDNQSQVEVTITGPSDAQYAPYRVAMSAGASSDYNSLHITGTGLIERDNYIDLVTGTTSQTTIEDVGMEVTNPYIDTLSRAITAGQYAAASKALTFDVSAEGYLFKPGDLTFGKVAGARVTYRDSKFRVDTATTGPTTTSFTASQDVLLADVSETYSGMTMGEVSAMWAGRTMLDFSIAPLKNAQDN